jgi:hypothetical protein
MTTVQGWELNACSIYFWVIVVLLHIFLQSEVLARYFWGFTILVFQFKRILIRLLCLETPTWPPGFCWVGLYSSMVGLYIYTRTLVEVHAHLVGKIVRVPPPPPPHTQTYTLKTPSYGTIVYILPHTSTGIFFNDKISIYTVTIRYCIAIL